ncbi:MAG: hypothetical protein PGN13_08480 [Patulibacter minatonensis]
MDGLRGNLTVGALVGTGAATLGIALFGIAGVGGEVRAADASRSVAPPAITEDLGATLSEERRSPKWDGHSPLATPCPTPAPTSPQAEHDPPPASPATPATDREI